MSILSTVLSVGKCFDNLLVWVGLHLWVEESCLSKNQSEWASEPVVSPPGFCFSFLFSMMDYDLDVYAKQTLSSASCLWPCIFFYLFLNHSNRKVTNSIYQCWSFITMELKKDLVIQYSTGSGNWLLYLHF